MEEIVDKQHLVNSLEEDGPYYLLREGVARKKQLDYQFLEPGLM